METSLLLIVQVAAGLGAVAAWTLGMYFWTLLDYASTPSRQVRRTRVLVAFAVGAVLGLVAWGARQLQA
jgi:hypothetical protein